MASSLDFVKFLLSAHLRGFILQVGYVHGYAHNHAAIYIA